MTCDPPNEHEVVYSEEIGNCSLACPVCGRGVGLSYDSLTAAFRKHEDSKEGVGVTVDSTGVFMTTDADDLNPSERRDGLTIECDCECGTKYMTLILEKHKGELRLYWYLGNIEAPGQDGV